MGIELRKKVKEIIVALEEASGNVLNMCSGNASRDAALYRSILFKIKDEMIPQALELCEEGEDEPKHTLEKTSRNIWAMDYTVLSRVNLMPQERIEFLSNWIKRYAFDLRKILRDYGRRKENNNTGS
jgi:hypothetical protein